MNLFQNTRSIRNAILVIVGIVLLAHLVHAALHCHALTNVTIQLRPEVPEHKDKSLLGIGAAEVLPDYEVVILGRDRHRWNLGFKKDTSAADGLTFPVAEPIPLRHVQAIVVQDKDRYETDVLDTTPILAPHFQTERFAYTIDTAATFDAFMNCFFGAGLGLVISIGIALGIAAAVFLHLA